MTICTILDEQLDPRKGGDDCSFNGFLEDYLNLDEKLDETLKEAFEKILEEDRDVKICVGLKDVISHDAISNQIIRYKDVFKLEGRALVYPYILYNDKNDKPRALLVVPYSPYGYIYAKGYYYCMTEPNSLFIDCKNEIVAVNGESVEMVVEAYSDLFKRSAGAVQRRLDRDHFQDYDHLKQVALEASNRMKDEINNTFPYIEDRKPLIDDYIVHWFLLKKVLYVQYMVNKDFLNTHHNGMIRRQRNQAKQNADAITFLSYSQMWRIPMRKDDDIYLQ